MLICSSSSSSSNTVQGSVLLPHYRFIIASLSFYYRIIIMFNNRIDKYLVKAGYT